MTTNIAAEEAAILAEGLTALRSSLASAGLAYAASRCEEEYQRVMDGAVRAADAGGLAGSDRRGYLAYMDGRTRTDVLATAAQRRDEQVTFAARQLAEWRRVMDSRSRSLPRGLHNFTDS
jgi:hypothetical protein